MNTATGNSTLLRGVRRNEEAIMDAYLEMLGRLQFIFNITGHPEIGETIRKAEAALGRR